MSVQPPSIFHGDLLTNLFPFLGNDNNVEGRSQGAPEINVLALISTVLDHAPPQIRNEKKGLTFQFSSVVTHKHMNFRICHDTEL